MFENKTTHGTGQPVTRPFGRALAAVAIQDPVFAEPSPPPRLPISPHFYHQYQMITRRQTANDDTVFWTLRLLQDNPGMTQRTLAKEVGINVSSINFCLKALVEKGWIKLDNFSKNSNKLSYAYLLTPSGMAEKAALTKRFLHRKMAEYEKLREEIQALQADSEQVNAGLENTRNQTT